MPHGGPPTECSVDRALLLRLSDDNWPIVSVKHRKDVYAHLDRLTCSVNHVTGGIEYVDLQVVQGEVLESGARRVAAPAQPAPPDGVGRREPRAQLCGHGGRSVYGQPSVVGAVDDVVEGRPVDELHHQTADVLGDRSVVHGGDVGVVQAGGCLGLPLEPGQSGGAPVGQGQQVRGDGLDSHRTLQIHVRAFPDVPHRTSAEHPVQPVPAAQDLARGELLHCSLPSVLPVAVPGRFGRGKSPLSAPPVVTGKRYSR